MTQTIAAGYFRDWNGDIRSIEKLGGAYSCGPLVTKGQGEGAYQSFELMDSDGLVIYEAIYYQTPYAIITPVVEALRGVIDD